MVAINARSGGFAYKKQQLKIIGLGAVAFGLLAATLGPSAVSLVSEGIWESRSLPRSERAAERGITLSASSRAALGDGAAFAAEGSIIAADEIVTLGLTDLQVDRITALGLMMRQESRLLVLGLRLNRFAVPRWQSPSTALGRIRSMAPGLIADLHHGLQPAGWSSAAVYGPQLVHWRPRGTTCGAGLKIGMIDTPLARRAPGLRAADIRRRSFLKPRQELAPPGHATAIAGLLVGQADEDGYVGLLPGAKLYAANIFTVDRKGHARASVVAFVQALEWLAEQRVKVVNVSLTGPANFTMAAAIAKATAKGMVVTAAAGNFGRKAPPVYPAALSNVLSITAVDRRRLIYSAANQGDYIDFAAPGVAIRAPAPDGWAMVSGTSFAVPFATAIAAAEVGRDRQIAVPELRGRLRKHALDLGPRGHDATFGWGLLQATRSCE